MDSMENNRLKSGDRWWRMWPTVYVVRNKEKKILYSTNDIGNNTRMMFFFSPFSNIFSAQRAETLSRLEI